MRIKTLLSFGITLSLAMFIIMGVGLHGISNHYQEALRGQELAHKISTGAQEISILSTELLIHPEPRSVQQWHNLHSSLTALLLESEALAAVEDTRIVLREHDKALRLFQRDIASQVIYPTGQGKPFGPTTAERAFTDQIQFTLQTLATHTARLFSVSNRKFQNVAEQLRWLVGFALLTVSLLIVSLWVIIAMRISPSITSMSNKIPALVTEPDYRLAVSHKDEIGLLAQAFNTLADNLQKTRVPRDDLVAEVRSRKLSETALRKCEEKLHLSTIAFEHSDEGFIIADKDSNIIEVNQAFSDILGYSKQEVLGKSPRLLQSGRQDKNFYRTMWKSIKKTGQWQGEIWNRHKNGSSVPVLMTINQAKDERGELTHYVCVFTDISDFKASQQRMYHLAHQDAVTGLPNRLLFNERLEQAIKSAERRSTGLAVIFADLDNFKNINDSFGHPVGDQLLKAVAQRLAGALRKNDTVARLGGDEFVILLKDISTPEHAEITVKKLLSTFSEPIALAEQKIHITTSLGICICPRDGKDVTTLTRNADAAMYHAKNQGRNTYHFYTEDLTHKAFERIVLENSLHVALEKEQLFIHYQPQVDIENGHLLGVEALLRWEHPELGMVPPTRFIPIAEHSGLIHNIGNWVLTSACQQGRNWLDRGIDVGHIAVNLSRAQLMRRSIIDDVQTALAVSEFPPDRLELEICEGFIMHQPETATTILEALRELGITLAIDDFGTEYSSLSYLKNLPIHTLKIDQSFVKELPDDSHSGAICNAVLALARALDLEVIAEGIETQEQAAYLLQAGCNMGQGFLYSPALSASELETMQQESMPKAKKLTFA